MPPFWHERDGLALRAKGMIMMAQRIGRRFVSHLDDHFGHSPSAAAQPSQDGGPLPASHDPPADDDDELDPWLGAGLDAAELPG